uniref:dolichyl-diphosphooligosaccharide--protein glycotransferase n=2 Tax=Manihot esculenta TaxID=3983 RepID=A0A2C9W3U8_MANES
MADPENAEEAKTLRYAFGNLLSFCIILLIGVLVFSIRLFSWNCLPGLTLTAGTIWWILNSLNIPLSLETVCVFTAPIFSAFASWATYLFTKEVKGAGAGLTAAALLAMVPSYISRSVAGSYDNEAVAIFALIFTYYLYIKFYCFDFQVCSWGGYTFIINPIPMHVILCIVTGQFSSRLYIAYAPLVNILVLISSSIGLSVLYQRDSLFKNVQSSSYTCCICWPVRFHYQLFFLGMFITEATKGVMNMFFLILLFIKHEQCCIMVGLCYQTTAMANRTVIVDKNTWNNTHIATVGSAMSSPEKASWEIFNSLDVKYVLEPDYLRDGQYRIDTQATPTMLNCLIYKLSYCRFVETDGKGFDKSLDEQKSGRNISNLPL